MRAAYVICCAIGVVLLVAGCATLKPVAPDSSQLPAPTRSAALEKSELEQQPEALPSTSMKPADPLAAIGEYPIDMPTALRLADADNVQVNIAREQVQQAYAEYNGASALWLPSIRAGMNWNKHEGPLQNTNGIISQVSRDSLYTGLGAFAIGSGTPAIPGIFASFNVADALFQPLAAQQRWGARENGATVVRNNTLLDVSLAYLELLRAAQDVAIAEDVQQKVAELSRITDEYARTGQGLQADADRLRVELSLRGNDIRRSKEAQVVASARLTQLLHLEPCLRLVPADTAVLRLCYVPPDAVCAELVAQGLSSRPELVQNRYLVGEAVQILRRQRFAPLVPSVLMGASYGGFGGGLGSRINDFSGRVDLDAVAWWEVRNLGFGEAAARNGASSRLRQAEMQVLATMDLVAREVTEAHAQVQLREQQIDTARAAVQFAVESYDRNLVRIQNGQGLPIEALQSAQALLQARREYLRSITDYNTAQFTLQRALGWPVGGAELGPQHEPQIASD